MKKAYEELKLNLIELSVADIVATSLGKDTDAGDIEDWGFLKGWGE